MLKLEEIIQKAEYCLNCSTSPCTKGCPLGNNIPKFINCIKNNDFELAHKVLLETTVLTPICGRICPKEKQCQCNCVRGIKGAPVSIGDLEAFIGDMAIEKDYQLHVDNLLMPDNKYKIAIVGSGPSGLTCAAFLRRQGYQVTIYEKYSTLGGLLRYGIPDFRLSKKILDNQIKKLLDLGIDIVYNRELGKDFTLQDLQNEFDAVFLAFGANISKKMNIPGENLNGVYGGNELLEHNSHPDYNGKKVAVIGGGNVAMDVSRTIKRLGAEKVYVIYRRSEAQMPAEKEEIFEAKKEGIDFLFQNNIVKINGSDTMQKVVSVECVKTELVKKDEHDRPVPVNIEGSNYILDVDFVVMAIGSETETSLVSKLGLKLNRWGYINVDENFMTSIPMVFAGGDLIGTEATVAWAASDGKKAAQAIAKKLE